MSSQEKSVDAIAKRILNNLDTVGTRLRENSRESAELKRTTNERLNTLEGKLKHLSIEQSELGETRNETTKLKGKLNEAEQKLKGFEEFEAAFMKLFRNIKTDAVREIVRTIIKEETSKHPTVTETGSMDENTIKQLVRDEVEKAVNTMKLAGEAGMPLDQLREEIHKQVEVIVQSAPSVVMVQPKEFLAKAVLKKEIDKVRTMVEGLQPQTRLMVGYLAASGKTASFKELMERFVGSDGGSQRKQYLYPLRTLLTVVEYDSKHGSIRYIWKERMKESYPDISDEELAAAMDQVHALLVEKLPQ